jgi:hypothetical protein
MHEVSLVSALVDQVEELARVQHFDRVLTIWLSVGALSGAEPSCIDFCFSEVTRSSVLEGAQARDATGGRRTGVSRMRGALLPLGSGGTVLWEVSLDGRGHP